MRLACTCRRGRDVLERGCSGAATLGPEVSGAYATYAASSSGDDVAENQCKRPPQSTLTSHAG